MSEPFVIKMPQLSDTMVEGVVVSWEKNIGDVIKRGDIIATVETDKAIMDVEVFRDGYLSGPRAPVDTVVPVGEPIAYLVASKNEIRQEGSNEEQTSTTKSPEPAQAENEANFSPAAPEGLVHTIKMPQLSDTMTEGVVVSWEKKPGDLVKRGDIIATVETDKAIMDVEVFRAGYLSGPMATVDSVVPVGEALAYLVEKSAQVVRQQKDPTVTKQKAASAKATKPALDSKRPVPGHRAPPLHSDKTILPAPRPDNKYASPYARKLAALMYVNLNTLKGSGPLGVIVAKDVQGAQPIERPSQFTRQTPAHIMPEIQVPGLGREMTAMERAVSHSMTASLTMPTFRVMVLVNPEPLKKAAKKAGVSMTVALAKACALTMLKHPRINWAYQPVDKIVERSHVDIGMAVSAEGGGLVVPVLRHCESRNLKDLVKDWEKLVERGRKRRLSPEEYANPTFMISNMGMLGVTHFDAIPTPGTAAILAVSSASALGMPLTMTADHRVINGAEVAQYLNTLKGIVEMPETWLSEPGPVIPAGKWDYDVAIIGAGPGGEDCARELAEHGLNVALINHSPLPGGECLWRGCIPSKTWRAAADVLRDRTCDRYLGVKGTESGKLDWEAMENARKDILKTRGEMALNTDKGMKIKYLQGHASFETPHRLLIDTANNQDNPFARHQTGGNGQGTHLSFGCAVIATGAPPFIPPIPGVQEALQAGGILTSDTVWHLKQLPNTLLIIGAGAIGTEMAQIFHDFGTKIVLIEAQDRILPEIEAEIAKTLTDILIKEPRMSVITQAKVTHVKGEPGHMLLSYEDAQGTKQDLAGEYVLFATGKRPVLEGLKLTNADIKTEKSLIPTDAHCRSNVPHIYAVGDVIGGYMLAHTAAQQGRVAAANILGEQGVVYEEAKDCGVIFTRPQAAFVGLSLKQAKEKGIDAVEVKIPLSIDAKAMITHKTQGLIKMVADKSSHRIVGVHFLADYAESLIGEAVMMVSADLKLEQVARAIHPHPTQTELFGDMARRLLSRLRRSQKIRNKEVSAP